MLIVGLGNPGTRYKNTFHNVGFMAVDALAKECGVRFSKTECSAKTARGALGGESFVLAKPETYMNLSGEAVKKLVRAYGVDTKNELIVCYDDVDLPIGKLRLRECGSAGTHNGTRNIVSELATEDFMRLRIGTRTEELAAGDTPLIDFVLSKIPYGAKPALDRALKCAVAALEQLIEGTPFARVQERLNHYAQ